ncbi:MAG: SusF/SusE family outer membrane protein, partial [Sphingobacteriales bacterium]
FGEIVASLTVEQLNGAAIAAGLEPETPGSLNVRIQASIGLEESDAMYSNTIRINVTPYQAFIPLAELFLVGDTTDHDWNNDNGNAPLFRDPANQFMYYYTGYFNVDGSGDDGFKLLTTLGSWHPQYGSVGEGLLGVSNADGSNEAGAIAVPSSGYYTLTVDTENMTYSLVPFDASAAPNYSTIGLIGSATASLTGGDGWAADLNMTNTSNNPHLWRASDVVLSDGEAKFREGDAWTNSWGNTTALSGQGNNNNDPNVPVFGGTYDIWFNDLDGRYIFVPIN